MSKPRLQRAVIGAGAILIAASVSAQGITGTKQGQGGSVVQGAAGTDGSHGDTGLEHCDKPMGALAVVEPQDYVITALSRYNLRSPVGLIRMMIQQSNCFIVVERGAGMQNMMQERALAASGPAAPGLEHGRRPDGHGRLRPHAGGRVLREQRRRRRRRRRRSARRASGGALAAVGRRAEVQGSADQHAGRRRPQQRAGRGGRGQHQEGRPRRSAARCSAAAWAAAAAATATPTRARSSPPRSWTTTTRSCRSSATIRACSATSARCKQEAAAGGTTKAGAVFNEGDVIVPKIANVRLLAQPNDAAKVLATLGRGEELVVVGAEKDGYINVQGAAASGWVKMVLVIKQ